MDVRGWKKILLQWITECSFGECNLFNIEQSNIDLFYRFFAKHHPVTKAILSPKKGCHRTRLIEFLEKFYSDYEVHYDDEGNISSADYTYVYSLLLHFCCVKYPEPYFHEICKKLSEQSQHCIASFFQELMDSSSFDRDSLRRAIANVAAAQMSPPHNESFSSSNGSQATMPSPKGTPMRASGGAHRISPNTPKTLYLEERTRELNHLRAMLETERYEKGVLELQIKQSEDIQAKHSEEKKKLQNEIQKLRNELLLRNVEGAETTSKDDEKTKRDLCKEIARKEQEISKLTELLNSSREDRSLAHEKLKLAETELVACANRIAMLENKVEELTDEIVRKNDTIKYLSDNRAELEQFIIETRAASASQRARLNISGDCLDASFTSQSPSSDSVNSPETLGKSVIDKQLREKEYEVFSLRQELTAMRSNNVSLAKHIYELGIKTSQLNGIEYGQRAVGSSAADEAAGDEEFLDPVDHFMAFAEFVDRLSKCYQKKQIQTEDLTQQLESLRENNARFEKEIKTLRHQVQELEAVNTEIEYDRNVLSEKVNLLEDELKSANHLRTELVNKLQTLMNEFDMFKGNCVVEREGSEKKIAQLQEDLEQRIREQSVLSRKNIEVIAESDNLQTSLNELKEQLLHKGREYDTQLDVLNGRLAAVQAQLDERSEAERSVREKYEKLLAHYEKKKQHLSEADEHLVRMREELELREKEILKLAPDIKNVNQKNEQLKERIDQILSQFTAEKETFTRIISEKDEHLEGVKAEMERLREKLQRVEGEMEKVQSSYQTTSETALKLSEGCKFLWKSLFANDESLNLESEMDEVFTVLSEKMEEMLKKNDEFSSLVDRLKAENAEMTSKVTEYEQQICKLQIEQDSLVSEHQATLENLKALSCEHRREYEAHLEGLKEAHNQELERMRREIGEMEQKHSQVQAESCAAYEALIKELTGDLEGEKKELDRVRAQLDESGDTVQNLEATVERLQSQNAQLEAKNSQLHEEYEAKLADLERKLSALDEENDQIKEGLRASQSGHVQTTEILEKERQALKDLTQLLDEQLEQTAKLKDRLATTERLLVETEQKLTAVIRDTESELEAKQHEIDQLQQTVEHIKRDHSEMCADKKKMLQEISKCTAQLKREQNDKQKILQTLETTAEQLRLATDENITEQTRLKKKIAAAEEENQSLKSELMARVTDLRALSQGHEQDMDEWNKENLGLRQKIADQSRAIEVNNNVLMEMMATLEANSNNAETSTAPSEVKNIFNADEKSNSKINDLKKLLNRFMHDLSQMQQKIAAGERERREAKRLLEDNQTALDTVHRRLSQQEQNIIALNKIISEKACAEEISSLEIKRLKTMIQQLDDSGIKIADENSQMQVRMAAMQEEINNLEFTNDVLQDNLKTSKEAESQYRLIADELKAKCEKLSSKCRVLEEERSLAQSDLSLYRQKCSNLEEQLSIRLQLSERTEERLQSLLYRAKDLEVLVDAGKMELLSLQQTAKHETDKLRLQLIANETLETELKQKNKEIASLQEKLEDEYKVQENLREEFQRSRDLLLANETRADDLTAVVQNLQRDLDAEKHQLQMARDDLDRCSEELAEFKRVREEMSGELKASKREIQQANENISQLIQQVASGRAEKEMVVEENQLLRQQIAEIGKGQTMSESKLQVIIEKSQALERELFASQNDLKTTKMILERIECEEKKLRAENMKLRAIQENTSKRQEKMAINLGEVQGRCSKLERENEKLTKTLESNNVTVKSIQAEKTSQQLEVRTLKERLLKADQKAEQATVKLLNVEKANSALTEANERLASVEIENKSKISKLEKIRESMEEKLKKLNHSVLNGEAESVRLNHQIGALNTELLELKQSKAEVVQQVECCKRDLRLARTELLRRDEVNAKLEQEIQQLRDTNLSVWQQLEEISLALQKTKDKCESYSRDIEQMTVEMAIIREEKAKVESEHAATCEKFHETESFLKQLIDEKEILINDLKTKIANLEEALAAKEVEILGLRDEINRLQAVAEAKNSNDNEEAMALAKTVESLRERLEETENLLKSDQATCKQLQLDNSILQAKYRDAKQRLADQDSINEERLKEQRLELEGKLEKMKNKMKVLYTEEITKIQGKQDREIAKIKTDLETVQAQNKKYEEYSRKLSTQIMQLNEKVLEYQRENTILATRLKHETERRDSSAFVQPFKRPSVVQGSMLPGSTATTATNPAAVNLGGNLAMEDEEGEVFNNTYLTDLKMGRMSEYVGKEIGLEEIQFRNSLVPPHLKSSYACQYDHGLGEDELKDGPHSLDDSMSALLSTTSGSGIRKKISGITHYKRPGPPTPSKHGGRLSLGGVCGSSEPAREILKECNDNDGGVSSTSCVKTPARFGFFSSRFSMGQSAGRNDENCNVITEERKNNPQVKEGKGVERVARGGGIKRPRAFAVVRGAGLCTSTPRKSKTHYDQRRVLNEIIDKSTDNNSNDVDDDDEASARPAAAERREKVARAVTSPDLSLIETPPATAAAHLIDTPPRIIGGRKPRRRSSLYKRSLTRRLGEQTAPLSSPVIVPSSGSAGLASLQRRLCRRNKRQRDSRPSIYLRGGIFSKYRTPIRAWVRDYNKSKARKQRLDCFNRRRKLRPEQAAVEQWEVEEAAVEEATDSESSLAAKVDDDGYRDDHQYDHYDDDEYSDYEGEVEFVENENFGRTIIVIKDETFEINDDRSVEAVEARIGDQRLIKIEQSDDVGADEEEEISGEDVKKALAITHDGGSGDGSGDGSGAASDRRVDFDLSGDRGNSKLFEKLLTQTESHAPFEVKRLSFAPALSQRPGPGVDSTASTTTSSSQSASLHLGPPVLASTIRPLEATSSSAVAYAASSPPPSLTSAQYSRTIYGGCVIYNRRLPHVNTTYARKSSIYIKNTNATNKGEEGEEDVILVTNQTITIVDLIRMWRQMSLATRSVVVFALTASAAAVGILASHLSPWN